MTSTVKTGLVPSLPPYQSAELDEIPLVARSLRKSFQSGKTRPVEFRLVQLRRLYWGLVDYESLFVNALERDLGRCRHESILLELSVLREDCLYAIRSLHQWVKDEAVDGIPLAFLPLRQRIRKEPLGLVLVIGAFNCPALLSLGPLIGAIAAGCTAVVKPAEGAPATAMAMRQLLWDWLDRDAYTIVNGEIPEVNALLDQRWDKIFFTGSQAVGRIVAQRAAGTLTPVVLELGGVNPAVVTRHANISLTGRRLMWAVAANAGQVCVKPNFVLVEQTILPELIKALQAAYMTFFPQGASASPDFSRIANAKQFDRIRSIMDRSSGNFVLGGSSDKSDLFIEPTVIQASSTDDSIIQEESFGPLLGLLPFDSIEEAIRTIHQICPTPLSLCSFGSDEENQRVLESTLSGGASLNDAYIHASIIPAPFSAVGSSGSGSCRGKASFDAFTHRRTVATSPWWFEALLRVRYMPYLPSQLRLRDAISPKPDFDRNGRRIFSIIRSLVWLLKLGSGPSTGSLTAIFMRWAILIAALFLARAKYSKPRESYGRETLWSALSFSRLSSQPPFS